MISAEVEGIKIIPLTPGFISSEQRKDPTQQESKTVGSPKDRAKEFVDGLRHHWKLNFPESTDTAVREELLAARERGELVIYIHLRKWFSVLSS